MSGKKLISISIVFVGLVYWGAVFNATGQGVSTEVVSNYFSINPPYNPVVTQSVGTSRHLTVWPFYVPIKTIVTTLTQVIGTNDGVNKYDLCIFNNPGGFNAIGNLVADLSADGSNGVGLAPGGNTSIEGIFHQGAVILAAGWYTYGFTGNATTALIRADSGVQYHLPYAPTDLGAVGTLGGACPSTITVPSASWGPLKTSALFALHN